MSSPIPRSPRGTEPWAGPRLGTELVAVAGVLLVGLALRVPAAPPNWVSTTATKGCMPSAGSVWREADKPQGAAQGDNDRTPVMIGGGQGIEFRVISSWTRMARRTSASTAIARVSAWRTSRRRGQALASRQVLLRGANEGPEEAPEVPTMLRHDFRRTAVRKLVFPPISRDLAPPPGLRIGGPIRVVGKHEGDDAAERPPQGIDPLQLRGQRRRQRWRELPTRPSSFFVEPWSSRMVPASRSMWRRASVRTSSGTRQP